MADNNKDDIEILDFVDNELMEISQEELDQMQSAFEELEASGSDDESSAGDALEADSAVVEPKSVDTRFSEPVDAGDIGDLDLGDADLGDVDDTEAKEAPAEEIKELSLDSSDVLADVNDVDAMLKDALGDLGDLDDLEDFDANELSSDLDESLLKEPEGAEEKADDAVEAVAEEKAEEPEAAEESAKGVDLNEEGEPILDLNGVPVDEEDISEISTILSKPDNNELVNDNLMDMLETAQEEKEQREYGENLPEIGETTYKTVVDEEEAIEEGNGSIEIVTESAVTEGEGFDELPPMEEAQAQPIEEVKEEPKEEPEKPKKEKKKKEKKPKKEPVEEDLDDDIEGKKKMSLWERIMAFLFESDEEEETEEGAEGEAAEGAEGEEGAGAPAKKGKKEKKKKEKKDKKGKKGKEDAEGEEGEESPKKKSKKDKGGDDEGDGEEGEGKKKKKKEKKPKKEKTLEEELKPRQKGISNKAVAAILLVCLSIAAVIVVLCYFGPRTLAINKANYDLYEGEYQEAALTLYGMKLNENDTLVYRKASLLNAVNTKLDQYDKFMAIKREDKALDALFKTITYCDTKKVEADNIGVAEEVAIVRNAALSILSDKYGVTEEQAEEICQMRPVYYTSAIESIMRGLPYDAFDPLDEESQQRAYDAQLESITGGEEGSESEEAAPEETLEDPLEGEPGLDASPDNAGEGNGEGMEMVEE
jgi:hypothetical protein